MSHVVGATIKMILRMMTMKLTNKKVRITCTNCHGYCQFDYGDHLPTFRGDRGTDCEECKGTGYLWLNKDKGTE